MSPITHLWTSSKQRLGIGPAHYRRQEPNEIGLLELQKLRSLPPEVEKSTPHASDVSIRATLHNNDSLYSKRQRSTWGIGALKQKRWLSGWRFGTINCAVSASIVFIINLVVTIWGSRHNKAGGNVLYEGDCNRVDRLNTELHLLINLLSTVLLSASNYSMQCLSAPTRKDIDKAHGARIWLDIGVPSIHNLRRISKKRALLWALLGLSSLPLHLL
jgi:hypothetical protein